MRFRNLTIVLASLTIPAISNAQDIAPKYSNEFLSIGVGASAFGMSNAVVAGVDDVTAGYWNPAGLNGIKNGEAMFLYQPWLVDINSTFAGVGMKIGSMGTIAVSIIGVDYGEMEVTTLDFQEGTGGGGADAEVAVFVYSHTL